MTTTPTARVSRLLTPGISAGATCAGLPSGARGGRRLSIFGTGRFGQEHPTNSSAMFPTTVASPRSLAGVGGPRKRHAASQGSAASARRLIPECRTAPAQSGRTQPVTASCTRSAASAGGSNPRSLFVGRFRVYRGGPDGDAVSRCTRLPATTRRARSMTHVSTNRCCSRRRRSARARAADVARGNAWLIVNNG